MIDISNIKIYEPSISEREKLNISWSNYEFLRLAKIENVTYFVKPIDIQCYINTKIFEELAKKIDLLCCPSLICREEDDSFLALSQSLFSISNGSYTFMGNILAEKEIERVDNSCLIHRMTVVSNRFTRKKYADNTFRELIQYFPSMLVSKYLKMIALDLYLGQKDRHQNNMQINTKTGDLAPLYDNELCLLDKNVWFYYNEVGDEIDIYCNPLIVVQNTKRGICDLLEDYPDMIKIFNILLETDFSSIIKSIIEIDGIKLKNSLFDLYLKEEEDIKKFYKSIL